MYLGVFTVSNIDMKGVYLTLISTLESLDYGARITVFEPIHIHIFTVSLTKFLKQTLQGLAM